MPLTPGANLGAYHVLSAIGSGSMGEVYRAHDPRLRRDVALKVLPTSVALDPDRLSRFVREAQLLASLNHPHIVTIHSVEEVEGVPFLTMEFVQGQPLDRIIAAGQLSIGRFLDVATAIADALVAAHDKGIVHRDLKPANVMLSSDGRIKVLDFGLAIEMLDGESTGPTMAADATTTADVPSTDSAPRGTTASRSSESTLTFAGRTSRGGTIGTPAYMAPEQVSRGHVDHRADLFALGVVLYELACGRRPFAGISQGELASSILRDVPAPMTDARADLPDELVRLIGHCLEKDPQRRVQTAREVLATLRDLARRPSEAGLAIAVLPFADLSATHDQEYFCEGMAEEIMNALFRVPGIRVASRTASFRARREGKDLAAIADALDVSHILDGSVRTSGSRLRATAQLTAVASGYQIWSEQFDREAADVFAVQEAIASGVVEAVSAQLVDGPRGVRTRQRGANISAYRAYLRGRHLRHTKNDFRGALASFEEAVRLDPAHGPSWVGLADAVTIGGVYSAIPARAACATAKAALATAHELEGESADSLQAEGAVAYLERRWSHWESAYRRAIELQADHPQALAQFGMTLCTRQRVDEAQAFFGRLRDADPLDVVPYAFAGAGLVAAGRSDDAILAFDDAFAIEPDHTLALWGAGMANVTLGHADEGIATLERGVTMTGRSAHFVGVLGWACAVAGRTDAAIALLDELRARPSTAPTVVAQGWLLGALGDVDAAFDVLARAEDEHQALLYYTGLPAFDALRGDPRFAALLTRLDLPPGR